MEELEVFKKRVLKAIDTAYSGRVCLLPFLDEAKLGIVEQMKKMAGVRIFYEGGFIHSDRVRAIVSNYEVKKEDFKIVVFEILYNKKYYSLTHRMILGSLMSLGIKRDCIGDIMICENKTAYFACSKEISGFIKEHLHTIGNASVELEETTKEIEQIVNYVSKVYFVSSLRLDVLISAAYQLSRSESLEMIHSGLVYIQHVLVQNSSHIVKLDDEISVRHKGRVKLTDIGGTSKSGRLAVTLAKRV